ncbi:MAG: NTPase [Anaerolineales bacterium]
MAAVELRKAHKILLTGHPGSGKTTAIERIVSRLSNRKEGFFTREIREGGKRVGFKIITIDGREGILAHVGIASEHRISKYGVDLSILEDIGVKSILEGIKNKSLVIIDEIGPMEILSERFRQAVLDVVDSDVPLLGSIVQRSTSFGDALKERPNVQVLLISHQNRDTIVERVLSLMMES